MRSLKEYAAAAYSWPLQIGKLCVPSKQKRTLFSRMGREGTGSFLASLKKQTACSLKKKEPRSNQLPFVFSGWEGSKEQSDRQVCSARGQDASIESVALPFPIKGLGVSQDHQTKAFVASSFFGPKNGGVSLKCCFFVGLLRLQTCRANGVVTGRDDLLGSCSNHKFVNPTNKLQKKVGTNLF